MGLVKTSAVLVALFAVGVQWLDQSGQSDALATDFLPSGPCGPVDPLLFTTRAGQGPLGARCAGTVRRPGAGALPQTGRQVRSQPAMALADALSALRAALELAAHQASMTSPFAAEGIQRLKSESKGARAWRAGLVIAALAFLAVPPPGSPRARLRALCYIVPLVAAAFYGPAPSAFSVKAVADGVGDLMRRNDAMGRLSLVGAATAFCAPQASRCAGPCIGAGRRWPNPALEVGKVDAALARKRRCRGGAGRAPRPSAAQPATFGSTTSRSCPRSCIRRRSPGRARSLPWVHSVEINQCVGCRTH